MAQAIATVLILLIFLLYAVFFSVWNQGMVLVTGYYFGPNMSGGTQVPLFLLPIAGVLIGAIVMALALWAPWSSLKGRLFAAEDRLRAESMRSKERARKIEALKSRVLKLQAQIEPASKEPAREDGGELDLSETEEV